MSVHPRMPVLFRTGTSDAIQPLVNYLRTTAQLQLETQPALPANLGEYRAVIAYEPGCYPAAEQALLERYVANGGRCLAILGHAADRPPEFLGVRPGEAGPETELRVRFGKQNPPLAARLPDAFYFHSRFCPLHPSSDHAEPLLYVDWRYRQVPVAVTCPHGDGLTASTSLRNFSEPWYQQLFYRILRSLVQPAETTQELGVGLLGYAPSVGKVHALGSEAVQGLALRAACDLNPQRLAEARADFPEITTYDSARALAAATDVDVVIIATPPNSHASLATQLLEAGKHVVCEKPLALTRAETEAMIEAAGRNHRLLVTHQNRRWDVDYLAIKEALTDELLGELFYIETFVGGYSHPCGYWHSHAPISGGTAYDWGAHYLDWVLSLIPDEPTAVISTRQNRVWHDVTNADQERVQLRFAGGQEAELIHSDIAAIRKPKWYLLGTEGAIVGHWRDVTVHEIDPTLYFQTHEIPATEMPPDLILQRRHRSGQLVEQTLPLPERQHFPFHHNLADHLLTGEPLAVPVEQSAQVVAVLEAANRSASAGGTVEQLDGVSG